MLALSLILFFWDFRYFMATPSAQGLLGGLLDHILLEPSIWIKTPLSLQCNLLSLFATGYVGCLDYAGYIRREVGVPRLILMLRKYYSLAQTTNQSKWRLYVSDEICEIQWIMKQYLTFCQKRANGKTEVN